MSRKIFIKTFGCQMNEYDTQIVFMILLKKLVTSRQIDMKKPVVIF